MTTTTTVDDNDQHDDQDDVVLQQRITLPHSGKDVMIITLNRPKRLNCFHQHLCHRLALVVHDIVTQLQQEQPLEHNDNSSNNDRNNTHHHNKNNNVVFAVILTANGSSFCAGADLTDPPNPLEQSMDLPECLQRNPAYQLSRVPVPIIGALRGHCITGGMELALCCDILIGDSTVVFRDTHVQFGLAPCWGLSQRLSQRIGPGRAKLISWTAQPIRAALAYEWGLLDELVVVNNDDVNKAVHGEETDKNTPAVLQRALEIAHAIGQNQSTMVQRYKRVMKTTCDDDEFLSTLTRERALALAHYLQVYGTNGGETSPTFANAKDFVTSKSRRRRSNITSSKL